MKTLAYCLLILSWAFISAAGQQTALIGEDPKAWQKISPPSAGFTILMPGRPAEEKQSVDTKLGKIENYTFIVKTGTAVYGAMYGDFPEVVSDPSTIKAMLDGARDNAISTARGKLVREDQISLANYAGREWFVELPGDLVLSARAFWVQRRLYQLIVVMPRAANLPADARKLRQEAVSKFFDSFKLN